MRFVSLYALPWLQILINAHLSLVLITCLFSFLVRGSVGEVGSVEGEGVEGECVGVDPSLWEEEGLGVGGDHVMGEGGVEGGSWNVKVGERRWEEGEEEESFSQNSLVDVLREDSVVVAPFAVC